jgi:NADP-dependent 3-hydroxy acid dehydrogenase YdfG
MKDFDYSTVMNKVVVITGASSGIGAALADDLARRGASVVVTARRIDALQRIAERIGSRARAIGADVTRRDQVRHVVDEAIRAFGAIDVWVNNAGQGITRPPSQLTDEDVDA